MDFDLPARIGADFIEAFGARLVDKTSASWEFWFGLLQRFAEREGHCRVIQTWTENGYALGRWVTKQRTRRRAGKLDVDRGERLEAVPGWAWDPLEDQWEEGFVHLRCFAEREGHARVPRDRVDDGFQLGAWVIRQRSGHGRGALNGAQVERLEKLPGWVWDARARPVGGRVSVLAPLRRTPRHVTCASRPR